MRMHELNDRYKEKWTIEFQDWNQMKLRDDLDLYEDFIVVGQSVWQKLIHYFGGAPEIGFYLIDKPTGVIHNEEAVRSDILTLS